MIDAHDQVQALLNFIDASPSPWHAVKQVEAHLEAFQFIKLDETSAWDLQPGRRYYVVQLLFSYRVKSR